jgi:HK97 family phage portal protein
MKVYERLDKGKREASEHPLSYLLQVEPNDEMTGMTFWESIVGSVALTGNGYAEIQRDAAGRPVGLWPLHPNQTHPRRTQAGLLVYETSDGMEKGKVRTLPKENVLHIPLFSFDGIVGINPIHAARQGIGLARAAEKFGAKFFGNGSRPGGVLSTPDDLEPDQLQAIKETWQQQQAGDKQGSTAVLFGNWKFESIGLSPEDSQFLQTRQFQRTEIAAMFRVPPNMVGDTSKLSNSNHEQMSLSFVTDTLRPYLCRIEAEVARKLLPANGRNSGKYFIKFDVSERLRGDFQTTMTGYATGRQWGWYSANDVRQELQDNPGPAELDVYLVPVNMQNAARLLDTESIQDQPIGGPQPSSEPTTEERQLLGNYSRACISVYCDAFGRLAHRNKRSFETISALFRPVLRSISNLAIEHNGIDSMPKVEEIIDDTIRSMEKRASKWSEVIADSDIPKLAQDEFVRAVRSIHINIARDTAANKAAAALTQGSNE